MRLLNFVYTFFLGVLVQKLLYKLNVNLSYRYEERFQHILNILTGIFFCFLWIEYNYTLEFFIFSFCTAILISISIIDSLYFEIADEYNLIILLLGITYSMINPDFILKAITGSFVGGGIYLLLSIISNGGFGGGDIKLGAATGLLIGPTNALMCVYFSFIIALLGFVENIYLSIKHKEKINPSIAFGPYISTAVIMTLLHLI